MATQLSFLDNVLVQIDQGVRTLLGKPVAERPSPANDEPVRLLTSEEQRHSAGLMRINHVGEVCAQALYAGQAITARSSDTREKMRTAAAEEIDHLAWCEQRLTDLHSHTSYLNPMWFAGSFALGLTAGLIGDKWSLGFVAETEHQVVRHLDSHLRELPANDEQSRAIVRQMRADEAKHATTALDAGGAELPSIVKFTMTAMSKMMTRVAYWV